MTDDIVTHTLRAVQMRLANDGVPPQRAAALIAEVDAEVRLIYGHERVYIAARGRSTSARDMAICSEYASGHAVARLASRYELSERQVFRVLARHPGISRYTAK